MKLSDAVTGQTVKVLKLEGTGPVKARIMEMGLTKGTRDRKSTRLNSSHL